MESKSHVKASRDGEVENDFSKITRFIVSDVKASRRIKETIVQHKQEPKANQEEDEINSISSEDDIQEGNSVFLLKRLKFCQLRSKVDEDIFECGFKDSKETEMLQLQKYAEATYNKEMIE